jgi:CheY-like chemotaxis protein
VIDVRVLLVEDYVPIQKSVARGLREAGFAVDVTGDGDEGLWYATGNDYDVVILDLMLPGLDGLSILQRMRSEGLASRTNTGLHCGLGLATAKRIVTGLGGKIGANVKGDIFTVRLILPTLPNS